MSTQQQTNGIDIGALTAFIEGIREQPAVTVRTTHRWDDGFAVEGRGESLELADEREERGHHIFRTDWPEPFGRDSGPTPGAESLMAAVGACVATTYIAAAARRNIPIDELEVEVEGTADLRGLFEVEGARAAFSGVTTTVRVHSSAADADLEELGRTAAAASPVYQSLATPVPMSLSVERRP